MWCLRNEGSYVQCVQSCTASPPALGPRNRPGLWGWAHHVLHADADLAVAVEGPVEAHDVWGVALVQHLQLSNDLVPDGRLDLQVDQLRGRWGRGQGHTAEGAGKEGSFTYLGAEDAHPSADLNGNVHRIWKVGATRTPRIN